MPRIGVGLGIDLLRANGLDPAASAFFAATGITGTTEQQAVNNLVTSLKSAGLWSKMKAVYPFVTDNRNLAWYSEDISSSIGWNSATITRSANTTTAPNATTTADTFTTTANGNNVFWNLGWIAGNGQTFTNSIYLKYNNAQWVTLEIWNGMGQDGVRLWVDVQNGVLGSYSTTVGTYISSSITSVGNGWYRVSLTGTIPIGNALIALRHVDGNGAYNFTAVNGKATYCWGAQYEIGTLTTYQPQLGSAQSAISNQFKYNLVNPVDSDAAFRGVFNGGWTFSNNGALPNGTNGYMDTKLNASGTLSANNWHLSYYSRTNNAVSSDFDLGTGGFLGEYSSSLILRRLGNTSAFDSGNASGNLRVSTTITDSTGFFVGKITSSSDRKYIRNNSVIASSTTTNSNALHSYNLYLSAYNQTGTAQFFGSKQCAFSSIGDGLTDTEATALYNAVQTFQTTLNRQV